MYLARGSEPMQSIAGERRRDRRYDIRLDMRWKLIRRRRVLASGEGRTIDMSSGGALIETSRPLEPGFNVELSISWPVLLYNAAPLQLVVSGRVLRTDGARSAIRMTQHELRTAGTAKGRPLVSGKAQAAAMKTAGQSGLGKLQ